MFQRILVPLDGSPLAEKAVPIAAHIARRAHGSIVITHIVPPGHIPANYGSEAAIATPPTTFEKAIAAATKYLAQVQQTYKEDLRDIAVEIDTETGDPSTTIISTASLEQADLIVMCSHNETMFTHWFLKHITQQTIRRSSIPILALNEHEAELLEHPETQPFHVLLPLDGSLLAEAAIKPTERFLKTVLAPTQPIVIHLMRVIETYTVQAHSWNQTDITAATAQQTSSEAEAYLQTIAQRLQKEWPQPEQMHITTTVKISAHIADTILQEAKLITDPSTEKECDLIAIATHGRSGLQRFFSGSVTEHIMGQTTYPLLVIHPQESHTTITNIRETLNTTII